MPLKLFHFRRKESTKDTKETISFGLKTMILYILVPAPPPAAFRTYTHRSCLERHLTTHGQLLYALSWQRWHLRALFRKRDADWVEFVNNDTWWNWWQKFLKLALTGKMIRHNVIVQEAGKSRTRKTLWFLLQTLWKQWICFWTVVSNFNLKWVQRVCIGSRHVTKTAIRHFLPAVCRHFSSFPNWPEVQVYANADRRGMAEWVSLFMNIHTCTSWYTSVVMVVSCV